MLNSREREKEPNTPLLLPAAANNNTMEQDTNECVVGETSMQLDRIIEENRVVEDEFKKMSYQLIDIISKQSPGSSVGS